MHFLAALALLLAVTDGMRTYKSNESIIKSNASAEESKALGKRIDHYCELFEEFYDELKLKKKNDNTLKLRLFATYDEYAEYHRRSSSGNGNTPLAYYSPSLNSIVMYSDEKDVALRAVVFHEASHQFLNRYTYDAPKWINEGLAEYFEGWRVIEGEPVRRRPHLYDLMLVQTSLRSGKFLHPSELVGMPPTVFSEFSRNHPGLHSYLHYATSWSLVYHAFTTSHEEDHERMVQYIRDLRDKGPNAEFVVDDWDAFVLRWKEHILRLDPERVDATDHFLVAKGYRASGEWAKAVEELKLALEKDPHIPGARYWLGYCYKLLGHYSKAYEVLEPLLVEDAEDPRVPYYLARMRLGIDNRRVTPEPERALEYAEMASELVDDKSPLYLWLMAKCQIALGDRRRALRTAKKILKVADKEEMDRWEREVEMLEQEAK